MSLLMEALKKAEEAKRLASEGHAPGLAPAAQPELTLKAMAQPADSSRPPPPTPPGSPLPVLSQHIDSVDADLAAVSTDAPVKRRTSASAALPADNSPRETAERIAARNVFAAKQAPASRTGLWLILGLAGIAAAGFGAYVWWQLQGVSGSSLARPLQALPAVQPIPPLPPVASAQTVSGAVQPLPETQPAPMFSAQKPASGPAPATTFERSPRAQRPLAAQDSPLRLSRSASKSGQTIERAYEALQSGHLDEAQVGYEEVLRNDAKSTDALLGMATIAARQGQAERAQAFYLLALESDPNDTTAQAGVINTRGQADPGLSESRLKTALASQPDSAALQFTLGNLYARQNRWSEAQQAYFKAYSSTPENADFIFNLAVSLDHLHQNTLAAQYYQMALKTAETRPISFDKNQVKARVLELQP